MQKSLFVLLLFAIHRIGLAQSYLSPQFYKLENGLSVYLLPDSNAKSTFGMVAIKAGSAQDPSDATGLAHYLEHLLFKGNGRLGTRDFQQEKPHLDSIARLYQKLGNTNEQSARKQINFLINEQEQQASSFGLPTEFNDLLKAIGATRINAFTNYDITAYHSHFPGEQVIKWVDIYSEIFQKPAFRSFQSELEVVYEEKNRASDDFEINLLEKFNREMFKGLPYGDHSVIGHSHHLKNPSLKRIGEFFQSWYVANNMVLILSGNFHAETALRAIQEKFSGIPAGIIPSSKSIKPQIIEGERKVHMRASPIRVEIIGYKTNPHGHPDDLALQILEYMLSNEGETGFLDGLVQENKLLGAFSEHQQFQTDGALAIVVVPKVLGQSFKNAEKLVMDELEKLKKGDFSDDFLAGIKSEIFKHYLEDMEKPEDRATKILNSFTYGTDLALVSRFPEILAKINREELIRVANKYFGPNHLKLFSRMGFPKKDKLKKPGFMALKNTRSDGSEYGKYFNSIPDANVKPRFLRSGEDIDEMDLGQGNQLFVSKNPYNQLARLDLKFHCSSLRNPNLILLEMALNKGGGSGMSRQELRKKLSAFHCAVGFTAGETFFSICLNGEEKGIFQGLKLIQTMLKQPEFEPFVISSLKEELKAAQKMEKKTPESLADALWEYALYRDKSLYINRVGLRELDKLSNSDLVKMTDGLLSTSASIHYCGKLGLNQVEDSLKKYLVSFGKGQAEIQQRKVYTPTKSTIFYLQDKKARQSRINFMVEGDSLNPEEAASMALLNEYLGGGFSGLILQEIREIRSLAYNAGGRFGTRFKRGSPVRFHSYIGCQSDKTIESVKTMKDILSNMPAYPERINMLRNYLKGSVPSQFPAFRLISDQIEINRLFGYPSDPNQKIFEQLSITSFEDMMNFYRKNIPNKPLLITISGSCSSDDLNKLREWGELVEVKNEQLFKE
jgi:zinc protease